MTVFLLIYSVVIAIVIAVPLAVISALQRNRATDHIIRLFSTITFAMPSFLLGLLLILFFSLKLGWLPTAGYGDGFVGHLRSLTLPAITVGLYLAPILLRTLRVGIIETLDSRVHRGGAGARAERAPDPAQARAAQLADLDGHGARAQHRLPALRARDHRERVRAPGPRHRAGRLDPGA